MDSYIIPVQCNVSLEKAERFKCLNISVGIDKKINNHKVKITMMSWPGGASGY